MLDFRKSCVYQIYPKSFYDTDGNGTGDIKGITAKLDYLEDLGVDYIWITPFYRSPQNDNGYDVQDYCSVDPMYGTMDDLEELIRQAERKNIKLMLDMVFNHTSTEHIWFQKALAGNSEYKDYYIFRKSRGDGRPPNNWVSKFGGAAWEYVEEFDEYYLHLFDKTQADLNWENPAVRREIKKILDFWIEKGIGGFRFDVINLISKDQNFPDDPDGDGRKYYTDGPRIHEYLKEISKECKFFEKGLLTVGEMSSTSLVNCKRYSNPDERELSMCFNFHHLKVDYKNQNKWELQPCNFPQLRDLLHTWQVGMQEAGGWNSVFWCNHDQPRIVSRFGDEGEYYEQSAKMLAGMIHLMRGTPYIYQGEEIGMTNAGFTSVSQYRDVESLNYYQILTEEGKSEAEIYRILGARSRDNSRTPMQWNDTENAGFTEGTPWIGINENYKSVNTEQNIKNESSIHSFYKELISIRKEYDVISEGSYKSLLTDHPEVFAYERSLGDIQVKVLANFFGRQTKVKLDVDMEQFVWLTGNYGKRLLQPVMQLEPYELAVFITRSVLK